MLNNIDDYPGQFQSKKWLMVEKFQHHSLQLNLINLIFVYT